MKPLSSVRKGPHTGRHNMCLPGEADKRGESEQMSPTVLSKRFGGQEKQRKGESLWWRRGVKRLHLM